MYLRRNDATDTDIECLHTRGRLVSIDVAALDCNKASELALNNHKSVTSEINNIVTHDAT